MSFTLRIFDGEKQTVDVREVTTPSVKIGRAPTCDIVLPSLYVSREHALIREQDGRYLLEAVGRNETLLRQEAIPSTHAVPVLPDEEIRIAQYSLFIEGVRTEHAENVDVSHALARVELEIHGRLLERVDLRKMEVTSTGGEVDHRLRTVLDELVRMRVPDADSAAMDPEVFTHALRESIYAEVVQDVLRSGEDASAAAFRGGFMEKLDSVLGGVVRDFRSKIELSGERGRLREDLRRVDAAFGPLFETFEAGASDQLRTLLVQRYLTREILNLVCGFGPLQDLLELPNTTEIMVVHKDLIYIERDGSLQRLHRTFITDEILLSIIQRIVDPLGRRIDRSTPLVDARLPDGSRVNAIIPPLAVKGPCLTIRKFSKDPLKVDDLIAFGSLTAQVATFLKASVSAHKNLVISGGTGSGKTTLLNILSSFIGESERIVTIEDSAELQLRQPHVVTLETRPPNVEGKGAYTIRDLVRNALRMRPDRVVVGECRGGEALDMLQAMNTGHDGSLTTLHANTPVDALLRLETMVLEAVDLPVRAIRDQIEAAIHVIVQVQRLPSGKRMVTHVSEVVGIDPVEGVVITDDIFAERDGTVAFTGYLPSFTDELIRKGHLQAEQLFAAPAEEVMS